MSEMALELFNFCIVCDDVKLNLKLIGDFRTSEFFYDTPLVQKAASAMLQRQHRKHPFDLSGKCQK